MMLTYNVSVKVEGQLPALITYLSLGTRVQAKKQVLQILAEVLRQQEDSVCPLLEKHDLFNVALLLLLEHPQNNILHTQVDRLFA